MGWKELCLLRTSRDYLLFDHLFPIDPEKHGLICEIGDVMVAFSLVYWEIKASDDWIYNLSGYLVPGWRKRGIGRAMLRHSEKCLREFACVHPKDIPKYFQRVVPESQIDLIRLLKSEGYQVVRYHYSMARTIEAPLPNAPMPAGLELRSAKEKDYRMIWDANHEAGALSFYKSVGYKVTNRSLTFRKPLY